MSAPAPFTFVHPLRIRWAECDAQGVVFNAQYYFLFDVGLTEYFRELGYGGVNGLEFFTVASSAEFLGSARFDEMVDVAVRIARLGRTSVHHEFAIFRDGETLTTGRASYVNCLPGTQEKAPLPEDFVAAVMKLERTPPER
ncbi:MAG: thioesterase family protein [Pseudomonadota bacterium]